MSNALELHLVRDDATSTRTIGRLAIDGIFACFTLEDPIRPGPKIAHETAIPAGRYEVVITKSVRFGVMLPLLRGVPGFEGIRIHAGNTAADTAGCVLVGQSRAHDSIVSSRLALADVQRRIATALAHGRRVCLSIEESLTT